MADPYRGGGNAGALEVLGSTGGLAWWRVALGVLLASAALVVLSHRVSLDCARATGVCVATDARLLSSVEKRVALGDVRGATVSGSDSTRVVLRTRKGDVPLSTSTESGEAGEKAAMARALEAFVTSSEPELHARYGALVGSSTSIVVALFALAFVVLAGRPVGVVVRFDRAARALVVERTLLGRSLGREVVDATGFTSAEVASSPFKKGRGGWYPFGTSDSDVFVALLDPSGERTPLPRWSSRSLGPTRALLERLNDALGVDRPIVDDPTGTPSRVVRLGLRAHTIFGVFAVSVGLAFVFVVFRQPGGWLALPMLLAPIAFLRGHTRRLLIYEGEAKVVIETSTFGLWPSRKALLRSRIQRAIVDDRETASTGVALLLTTGEHVALTAYSNVAFGAAELAARVNDALGAGA